MPQYRDPTKGRQGAQDVSAKAWAESASKSPDDFPDDERAAVPREPMTAEQAERLRALAEAAHEPFDSSLSRREADQRIAELEHRPLDLNTADRD